MNSDYASVAALTEHEQSLLLESGDAPERLWAAWALALRHGKGALPTLTAMSSGTELTEGLKRQLLVVLAGLGARAILSAIATTDPSADVRATATANYIRTASPNEIEATLRFALEQLHTGIVQVVLAVLSEHEMSRLDLPEREVTACLEDQRPEVRQAAANCLLKRDNISSAARECLLRALVGEETPPLRDRLHIDVMRPELPFLLGLLKNAPAKQIVQVLANLKQQFGLLPWNDLRELSVVSDPSVIDVTLSSLDVPLPDEAIPWLGTLYPASKSKTDHVWRDIQWRVSYSLRRSLTTHNVQRLDQEAIGLFRREIEDDLAYFNSIPAEERDEYDYFEEDGVELARLLSILLTAEVSSRDERSPTQQ